VSTEKTFTRILKWPGYRVYRHELNEKRKTLRLWVEKKPSRQQQYLCSGCGQKLEQCHDRREREVRDLPWSVYRVTVVLTVYRVNCSQCGVKTEKIEPLPGKAPFSLRFEDEVGLACENTPVRQVARRLGLGESTVRSIDQRYLERWRQSRKVPDVRRMGIDEIYLGRQAKFITVVSDLDTGEPIWFGPDRKKETLDRFFQEVLTESQRELMEAACVDMWEPYTQSLQQWVPHCRIVYDKFHVLQHANRAVDEVRRAEFFRKGAQQRQLIKGKRWLLLSGWENLNRKQKNRLQQLFILNRRILKAYLLKESLEQLWSYTYEGAASRFLLAWLDQLKWQRLKPFEKLGAMLAKHYDGLMNYCKVKVPFGVVEALNSTIRAVIRRGRGYKNTEYLLLKVQKEIASRAEFTVARKAA
jgi:transposase